ncbi:IS66 family insertion sequence element accessory protein TnpA [Anaerovoracaceae bacterium SGI.174]
MNEMVKIQHQQWARDLDDQRRSGLTQREWCRKSNLPFSLQNWMFKRTYQRSPVFVSMLRTCL